MPADISLFMLTFMLCSHNPSAARRLEEFITFRVAMFWFLKLELYLELNLISPEFT